MRSGGYLRRAGLRPAGVESLGLPWDSLTGDGAPDHGRERTSAAAHPAMAYAPLREETWRSPGWMRAAGSRAVGSGVKGGVRREPLHPLVRGVPAGLRWRRRGCTRARPPSTSATCSITSARRSARHPSGRSAAGSSSTSPFEPDPRALRVAGQEEVQAALYRTLGTFVRSGRVNKLILLARPERLGEVVARLRARPRDGGVLARARGRAVPLPLGVPERADG